MMNELGDNVLEPVENPLPNGVELIYAERLRQMGEEGWTADHDAHHTAGEMGWAAAVYIRAADQPGWSPIGGSTWPWDMKWYKPASPIRMLVKAGALIAAEIDRRQAQGERP
jgi:hypothetical protein